MKKRQLNLPAGHHDSDSASQLLGVSKVKLLATLREAGFLEIDKRNGLNGRHNLPRKHIKDLGWAYELTRSYGSGPSKRIDHEYKIVIFTHTGFQEVKKIMTEPETYRPPEPQVKKVTPPPSDCAGFAQSKKRSTADSPSRKECLDLLNDWGIGINKEAS